MIDTIIIYVNRYFLHVWQEIHFKEWSTVHQRLELGDIQI